MCDTLRKGSTPILDRTVGTDVVVILVEVSYSLVSRYPVFDLWVGFGACRHFLYCHISSVGLELGEDK